MQDSSRRDAAVGLLMASFGALFLELALIRWLPYRVRVVAYFPNLILIAAFLGLGIGALCARRRSLFWAWPWLVLIVVTAGWAMSRIAFTSSGITEHLWLLYDDLGTAAPVVNGIRLPLVFLFLLTAISFVPLGQLIGTRLEQFRRSSAPLRGYAFDLGGSLLGVIAFAALSWFGLAPIWWFIPPLVAGFVVADPTARGRVLYGAAALAVLALVYASTGPERFSPYYALQAFRSGADSSVVIRANGSVHQIATDMVTERGERSRLVTMVGYHYPYSRLGRPVRKALVLGAGSGNDVAVLLRQGAAEVHAVEIDPEIIEIGRALHPNQPYSDPRVVVHNTDARTFLNATDERFDVIVFGTLDSMTRLSALSTVRLDNFVYTSEALEAARDRLTDDGALLLYFMVGHQYIADHLIALLAHTFGAVPQMHRGDYYLFNVVFMAGPAFAGAELEAAASAWSREDLAAILPTDDWPYLYLPGRGISSFYVSMMVILALVSVGGVLAVSPEMRRSLGSGRGIDAEMFLFGFAFLLIETRFVTAMNLLWGATWITSAVVFGAILAVILAGTLITERRPVSDRVTAVGLVATLLVAYALPLRFLLAADPVVRLALSVLLVGAPVLFASFCFAARFRTRASVDVAFGWNLLGAVFGGLFEFFSMAVGSSVLTLVAVAAYLGAFLIAARAPRRGAEAPLAASAA
jgi:spermidine synthase